MLLAAGESPLLASLPNSEFCYVMLISHLKLLTVTVFTPWELAYATKQSFKKTFLQRASCYTFTSTPPGQEM